MLPSPCRGSSFAATLRANLNLTPLNSKTKEKGQPTKSTKRQREGENKQPSRHVTWNIKKLKTRLCFSPYVFPHLGFAFNSWTRWLFKMRLYIPLNTPSQDLGPQQRAGGGIIASSLIGVLCKSRFVWFFFPSSSFSRRRIFHQFHFWPQSLLPRPVMRVNWSADGEPKQGGCRAAEPQSDYAHSCGATAEAADGERERRAITGHIRPSPPISAQRR